MSRGVQRAAEELLFHAEVAFDVEHVQAAFEHLHKGTQLVVRRHQLAGLADGLQGELVFARLLWRIAEIDRHDLPVFRGRDFRLLDDLHLVFG